MHFAAVGAGVEAARAVTGALVRGVSYKEAGVGEAKVPVAVGDAAGPVLAYEGFQGFAGVARDVGFDACLAVGAVVGESRLGDARDAQDAGARERGDTVVGAGAEVDGVQAEGGAVVDADDAAALMLGLGHIDPSRGPVVAIVSGGNVEPSKYAEYITRP